MVAALIGASLLSGFLVLIYFLTVEGDFPPDRQLPNFRFSVTLDLVQMLGLLVCSLAALKRPIAGVAAGAFLIVGCLLLQVFLLDQALGRAFWISLLQGIAIGYASIAALKAEQLRKRLLATADADAEGT